MLFFSSEVAQNPLIVLKSASLSRLQIPYFRPHRKPLARGFRGTCAKDQKYAPIHEAKLKILSITGKHSVQLDQYQVPMNTEVEMPILDIYQQQH